MTSARPRQYQAEPVRQQYVVDKVIHVGGEPEQRVWTRPHVALFVFAVLAAVAVFFGPLWTPI